MKTIALAALLFSSAFAQEYTLGPDSQPHEGVPKGKITQHTWASSKIYPGSTRSYWVYVPAQYDASKPACVMVFQDGAGFQSERGAWRAPVVLDNLIHQRAMPVTIAIFIDPGVLPAASPDRQSRFNRSYEYDALGPRYARFLIDEILPEVGKEYKLSSDPNDRALVGSSSGGIAAFVAAWERPDAFRRVLSFVGSFTNLRGGDTLHDLIRKVEPKPLRLFLQDGSNDQNIYGGNWFIANQAVASSLAYAGYDVKFVVGTEGHNSRHGSAILPDALRWIWRDYPQPVANLDTKSVRHYVREILDPAHDWEEAASGFQRAEGLAVDATGNVFVCDSGASKIFKVGPDGKSSVFRADTGNARAAMFGPDGRLYAVERSRHRVVAYRPDGKADVLANGGEPTDLAVTSQGVVYYLDFDKSRVWSIAPGARPRIVNEGDTLNPKGLRINPDESMLLVADHLGRPVWSYRIEADGGLADGQPFYHLELPDAVESGPLRPGSDGMTFDTTGHLYVATNMGVQVCDQAGRVVGIIRHPPADERSLGVVFAGKDLSTLYASTGTKLFRRTLRRQGHLPWQPVKLPRPQL
jgi:enterochelin esterase-like enzyme/sugar lactone lactonase YvrE